MSRFHFALPVFLAFCLCFSGQLNAEDATPDMPDFRVWKEYEDVPLKPTASIKVASLESWFAALERMINDAPADDNFKSDFQKLKGTALEAVRSSGVGTDKPFGFSLMEDDELFYLLGFFPVSVEESGEEFHGGEDDEIHIDFLADPTLLNDPEFLTETLKDTLSQFDGTPRMVKGEEFDIFAVFGGKFGVRSENMIILGTDGIQKRVMKDIGKFTVGPEGNGVLIEEKLVLEGWPRTMLKNILQFSVQSLKTATATLESNVGFDPSMIMAAYTLALRPLPKIVEEIEQVSRTFGVDEKSNDMVLTDTLKVRPNGYLSGFFVKQRDVKSPLLGFYQPDDSIAAAIIGNELLPEQVDLIKMLLKVYLSYTEELFGVIDNRPQQLEARGVAQPENDEPLGFVNLSGELSTADKLSDEQDENIEPFDPVQFLFGEHDNEYIAVLACVDYIERFVEKSRLDAAFSFRKDGTLLGAIGIVDGNSLIPKLDELKKELAAREETAELAQYFEPNVDEISGTKFSLIKIPVAKLIESTKDDPAAQKLWAPLAQSNMLIVIGVRDDFIFFAACFGNEFDAVRKTLQAAINGIEKPGPMPETIAVFSISEAAKFSMPLLLIAEQLEKPTAVKAATPAEDVEEAEDEDAEMNEEMEAAPTATQFGPFMIKEPEPKDFTELMRMFGELGPDAKITYGVSYAPDGAVSRMRISGKSLATFALWFYRHGLQK